MDLILSTIKKMDKIRLAALITSALSVLFFLISTFNTNLWDWILLIVSVYLTLLVLKQERYDSKMMAIPFLVFFAKNLLLLLFLESRYIYGFYPLILNILAYLLFIACTVVYILIVFTNLGDKKILALVYLVLAGLLAFFCFISSFFSFRNYYIGTFTYFAHRIGKTLILASYFLLTLQAELGNLKKFANNKSVTSYHGNRLKYCEFCSKEIPGNARFCDLCGRQQPVVSQPVVQPQQSTQGYQQSYQQGYERHPVFDRNPVTCLLLNLVTCGIYGIILYYQMAEEVNVVATKYDGKTTMNFLLAMLISIPTFGIYSCIWAHTFCERIGNELKRRNINYEFSEVTYWLWGVLGSLIYVGPIVFFYKLITAMNLLNEDYSRNG